MSRALAIDAKPGHPLYRWRGKTRDLFVWTFGPSCLCMGALAFADGALGHAFGNVWVGCITIFPEWVRIQRLRKFWTFVGSPLGTALIIIFPALLLFVLLMLFGGEQPHANPAQAAGGWLLASLITAMIAESWGKNSGKSWSYLALIFLMDLLLAIGAYQVGSLPLLALEVFALYHDLRTILLRQRLPTH